MGQVSAPWQIVLLAGAVAISLSACAARSAGDPHEQAMSWLGGSAEDLEKHWGPPNSSRQLASGETVLQYSWSRSVTTGGYTVSSAEPAYSTGSAGGPPYSGASWATARWYVPSETEDLACNAEFTVGRDNHVRAINLAGKVCLGFEK
jgi:hypothetical protein